MERAFVVLRSRGPAWGDSKPLEAQLEWVPHPDRPSSSGRGCAGRDEMGYDAAVPERAVFHDAPAASSFLYLISACG